MKSIEVVAAIICRNGTYLTTQRGYGDFKGFWEFPGGKIEFGESHEVALKREIREELGINISIEKFVCTTDYDYSSFHLTMHCYLCNIVSGEIELREHIAIRWLNPYELNDVKWLPADKEIIDKLV